MGSREAIAKSSAHRESEAAKRFVPPSGEISLEVRDSYRSRTLDSEVLEA